MQKELIYLCTHHFCVEMLETSKFHPNECGRIVGYRNIASKIFYTVIFSDYSTIDIPSESDELLKLCKSLPFQLFSLNSD